MLELYLSWNLRSCWEFANGEKGASFVCLNIGIRILFSMPLLCFKYKHSSNNKCAAEHLVHLERWCLLLAWLHKWLKVEYYSPCVFFSRGGKYLCSAEELCQKKTLTAFCWRKPLQSLWSDNQTGKYNWFAAFKRSWSDQSCNSGTQREKKSLHA